MKYAGRFIENVPGFPDIKWFLDSDIPDNKIYAYDKKKISEEIRKKELEKLNKSL